MLKDAGCDYVIVGHSERRQYFGETDETVNRRLKAALAHGLKPIFCVGETLREREEEKTFAVIQRQLEGGLKNLEAKSSSTSCLPMNRFGRSEPGRRRRRSKPKRSIASFVKNWPAWFRVTLRSPFGYSTVGV